MTDGACVERDSADRDDGYRDRACARPRPTHTSSPTARSRCPWCASRKQVRWPGRSIGSRRAASTCSGVCVESPTTASPTERSAHPRRWRDRPGRHARRRARHRARSARSLTITAASYGAAVTDDRVAELEERAGRRVSWRESGGSGRRRPGKHASQVAGGQSGARADVGVDDGVETAAGRQTAGQAVSASAGRLGLSA